MIGFASVTGLCSVMGMLPGRAAPSCSYILKIEFLKGVKSLLDDRIESLEKKGSKKAVAKKAVAKKTAPKKTSTKKTAKKVTAADTVLKVISRLKKGTDTSGLMKKTGFNQKKVANILFKLKKQGKITSPKKGLYVKA